MKYKTIGLGCLALVGCKDQLPGGAPEFRVEVGIDSRSESFFCTSQDEDIKKTKDSGGTFVAPALQSDEGVCLRFTVLKTTGEPVNGSAKDSSCSISPKLALEGDSAGVALSLKSDLVGGPIGSDQQYLIRTDLFQGGVLTQTGLVGSFALNEEIDTARALSFMKSGHLSCIPPSDFIRGVPDVSASIADKGASMLAARGFHGASLIGDYAAGDGEGVIVSGGAHELRDQTSANETNAQLLNSVEVFNRTEMRFKASPDVTLQDPRAFHQSITLPTRDGVDATREIQVVLVGGTTNVNGLGQEFRLFGGSQKSPIPILPLKFFTAGAISSYAADEESGAESVTLDAKTLKPKLTEKIDVAPGRFGAAVVSSGERIIYFGGVATNTKQNATIDGCADLTLTNVGNVTETLTDFLCHDGVILERGATNQANNFTATFSDTMGVARIGASAVRIDDGSAETKFLVMGGAIDPSGAAPADTKIAQIATLDEATGVVTYQDLTIDTAGLFSANLLNRAFFGLAQVPGTTDQFALFGGDRINPTGGRLVDDTVDVNVRGVPNIAALLTLSGTTLTAKLVTGASIGTDPIADPTSPLTRPSVAASLLAFSKFDFSGAAVQTDFTYSALDIEDEDKSAASAPGNRCGNASLTCQHTNIGERIAYPMVANGPGNSVLFAGGIRGTMFPQDAILQFTPDGLGGAALTEVANPADPNCNGDCSLHLFHRVVGGAAISLPQRGAGDLLMFIGGIEGVSTPSSTTVGLTFFESPEKSKNVGVAGTEDLAARRDASYFLFNVPDQSAEIVDACDDQNDTKANPKFTESAACGFANSSLKPRKLFFIPIGGVK